MSKSIATCPSLARPKSLASSSRMFATRERASRKTRFSTRLSIRLRRVPICRVISNPSSGRAASRLRKTSPGIFQTRLERTACA
jgi:hypothetical protein